MELNKKQFKKLIKKEVKKVIKEKEHSKFDIDITPKEGESYKDFFERCMDKVGIDSPDELSKGEREKFFADIEEEWTKENPETDDNDAYGGGEEDEPGEPM